MSRELDVLVARAMGHDVQLDFNGMPYLEGSPPRNCPRYSSDSLAADELFEWLAVRDFDWSMRYAWEVGGFIFMGHQVGPDQKVSICGAGPRLETMCHFVIECATHIENRLRGAT